MKVAILGAGGIGYSYAAFLASRGHMPVLWSPSGVSGAELAQGAPLVASGALEGSFAVTVASDLQDAFAGAEAVILAVPAYRYKPVLDRVLPALQPGQSLILSAHLSFAALYASRKLHENGQSNPILVWNTTASTGRKTGPCAVSLSMLRAKVEMAVIPADFGPKAMALCEAMFGPRFALKTDMIAVDLGNLNPALHMAVVLFNVTRIERGEAWLQTEMMTPALCRFLEDLDRERLALAAGFGVGVRTIHQAYEIPGKVAQGPLAQMMAETFALRKGVAGPKSPDTRYVTEDVPFGLQTTVMLGEMLGIDLPLHRAGIAVFSALYGRDFAAENDILPQIRAAFATPDHLRRACAEGWAKL